MDFKGIIKDRRGPCAHIEMVLTEVAEELATPYNRFQSQESESLTQSWIVQHAGYQPHSSFTFKLLNIKEI